MEFIDEYAMKISIKYKIKSNQTNQQQEKLNGALLSLFLSRCR